MLAGDPQAKKDALANLLNGAVVDDSDRVAISIRGAIDDFPARLEAILPHWPFGVMYTVQTVRQADAPAGPSAKITLYPRIGRGMSGILTNILLFEGNTTRVNEKRLDSVFNFAFENRDCGERFIHYPSVADLLLLLEERSQFSECVIRTDAGIYLSQPKSFNALDLNVCQQTFQTLGQLSEILSSSF